MPRVNPPKRTDTCPGCKGTRKNIEGRAAHDRAEDCPYCDGVGKVTNHKYKTLLRYLAGDVGKRRKALDEPTLR